MSQPTPASAGVGLRSERGPVLGSVMLGTALIALDATILATAVPSVVSDLGGFAQFPWLFSIYVLAQAVSVPIYGKLADQIGRKPIMLFGIGLFVLGSILCGIAWSMPALIGFRAVQGLGAGAIGPMGMTIIGDIYSVAERAKVQGYVASVWGISSVVGPTLGGVFTDFISWRAIFAVNIPLGVIAAWMLWRNFDESVTATKHKIDFAGAATLAVGTSLIILGLLEGGVLWQWSSPPSVLIFVVGAVVLVLFVIIERHASEPVLPGWAFTRRIFVGVYIAAMAVGVLTLGLSSYVPMFVQEVLGTSALIAGFALAGMTLGWPVAASQAGKIYLRIGFRNTALIGGVFGLVGTASLLLLGPGSSPVQVGLSCVVIGIGMGLIASPTLVAAQAVVGWQQRGVVTATNMFARSMGSAVGTAVFGAIANATLSRHGVVGSGSSHEAGNGAASGVPPLLLSDAVHQVFLGAVVIGVLMLVAIMIIPRRIETAE
ncbi:MDR family MFS transporter [Microlunatus soli]|uniref:Drug resistance transporter, EmrB/QacA subfamily n=1 Tax=Microlunatus soli TaxID=630515 RepID=A0A1H1RRH9_9ACTN|nr:MDR family MFS transporter [Microlunatus soli]SDS37629.1 drug resistance transporter, EmrB/QacA subfamily [Microlunatus soli]